MTIKDKIRKLISSPLCSYPINGLDYTDGIRSMSIGNIQRWWVCINELNIHEKRRRNNETFSCSNQRGGIKEDKDNFVKLIKSLKSRLSKRNKLVTAAIGATSTYIRESYAPMRELCE
jgi:hypothetical protein